MADGFLLEVCGIISECRSTGDEAQRDELVARVARLLRCWSVLDWFERAGDSRFPFEIRTFCAEQVSHLAWKQKSVGGWMLAYCLPDATPEERATALSELIECASSFQEAIDAFVIARSYGERMFVLMALDRLEELHPDGGTLGDIYLGDLIDHPECLRPRDLYDLPGFRSPAEAAANLLLPEYQPESEILFPEVSADREVRLPQSFTPDLLSGIFRPPGGTNPETPWDY